MRRGFTLIELLVTVTIFSIVVSIVIFFYIQSQKHILAEQERGYLDDQASENLHRITDEILKADGVVRLEQEKIVLRQKTGEMDSIFSSGNEVFVGQRRLSSQEDTISFRWQDAGSTDLFLKDVVDEDGNGILEGNELENLKIIYVNYTIKKSGYEARLGTSVYLRK
jgi:prepilin-type N-terminal cleavage/methylation domain-containing protein